MQYAIDLAPFERFADARLLGELAHEAEEAGWDAFFIWDHVIWATFPVVDPWVALSAMALRTERIQLGAMVTPLPRRRPTKVARETASLDRLSNGRLIFGVGIGGGAREYDNLGEQTDPKARGAMLDEALDILTGLWTGEPFRYAGAHYTVRGEGEDGRVAFQPAPVQQPRIPIWVAGVWPNKAPFRRAARWDGVAPLSQSANFFTEMIPPEQVAAMVAYIREQREHDAQRHPGDAPYAVTVTGISTGDDAARDAALVAQYEAVGVNWWRENVNPWRFGWNWQGAWPFEAMRERIRKGPPRQ